MRMLPYGPDDLSRHLLYVGITRAAHQLWLLHCGNPSSSFQTPSAEVCDRPSSKREKTVEFLGVIWSRVVVRRLLRCAQ